MQSHSPSSSSSDIFQSHSTCLLHEHMQDFLLYIGSEKGLAQNTIEAYERDCLVFIDFLVHRGINDFEQVQQQHIVDFLSRLKAEQYASSSMCRTLIAIKVLFRFLKREEYVKTNVALYISTPKLWQLIPQVLTLDELNALLSQPDIHTPIGARDKAIIEVLYGSGLRVSELCSLGLYDIDDTSVRVMGKGNKERMVPIGKKAIEAVDYYLTHFRGIVQEDRYQPLFVSSQGRPIDRQSIWKMIKCYAKKAKINKNISPHTLRHSFATHLLDNGADLRIIQEMLGHANIGSTDRYTHVSQTQVQRAFQSCHLRW